MLVSNIRDKKIYAYNLENQRRLNSHHTTDDDFVLYAKNRSLVGIWSDGETLWVANRDTNNAKIYAYKLTGDCRKEGKDFNTLKAVGNHHPSRLWSDGTSMWVADSEDDNLIRLEPAALRKRLARRLGTKQRLLRK